MKITLTEVFAVTVIAGSLYFGLKGGLSSRPGKPSEISDTLKPVTPQLNVAGTNGESNPTGTGTVIHEARATYSMSPLTTSRPTVVREEDVLRIQQTQQTTK